MFHTVSPSKSHPTVPLQTMKSPEIPTRSISLKISAKCPPVRKKFGKVDMEKDVKNWRPTPPENFLQWGNTKRLRCVKVHVRDDHGSNSNGRGTRATVSGRAVDRRSSSVVINTSAACRDSSLLSSSAGSQRHPLTSHCVLRNNSEASPFGWRSLNDHSSSPEKSERQSHHQTKVGSVKAPAETMTTVEKKTPNQSSRVNNGGGNGNHENIYNLQPMVWPKFIIALSSKEKEEDFMAMKGSKLPQRPKKRSKFLQRTLNLVSPGSWLCELTQERYEVREKKSNKKRAKGLKAMVRSMDSESD